MFCHLGIHPCLNSVGQMTNGVKKLWMKEGAADMKKAPFMHCSSLGKHKPKRRGWALRILLHGYWRKMLSIISWNLKILCAKWGLANKWMKERMNEWNPIYNSNSDQEHSIIVLFLWFNQKKTGFVRKSQLYKAQTLETPFIIVAWTSPNRKLYYISFSLLTNSTFFINVYNT